MKNKTLKDYLESEFSLEPSRHHAVGEYMDGHSVNFEIPLKITHEQLEDAINLYYMERNYKSDKFGKGDQHFTNHQYMVAVTSTPILRAGKYKITISITPLRKLK
ncbi:hypothetical protein KW805_00155 [Candidatus Pacearchaeota archaeon]|nr:hypothetical protein [Candidatus Pacearchaeota archaeon]